MLLRKVQKVIYSVKKRKEHQKHQERRKSISKKHYWS